MCRWHFVEWNTMLRHLQWRSCWHYLVGIHISLKHDYYSNESTWYYKSLEQNQALASVTCKAFLCLVQAQVLWCISPDIPGNITRRKHPDLLRKPKVEMKMTSYAGTCPKVTCHLALTQTVVGLVTQSSSCSLGTKIAWRAQRMSALEAIRQYTCVFLCNRPVHALRGIMGNQGKIAKKQSGKIQLFQKRLLLWSMMHDPCFIVRSALWEQA